MCNQPINNSVPTLYGKFEQTLYPDLSKFDKSTFNASPKITSNFPSDASTIFNKIFCVVLSFSIAITCFAPAIRIARVKPPGPGPTSSTVVFSISGILRAIRPVKFKSNKKFCPNCFLGSNPESRIISDTGGKFAILFVIISFVPRTPKSMFHHQYNQDPHPVEHLMLIQKIQYCCSQLMTLCIVVSFFLRLYLVMQKLFL